MDVTPAHTYRPFIDESEAASGDNITYADESEYIDDGEEAYDCGCTESVAAAECHDHGMIAFLRGPDG